MNNKSQYLLNFAFVNLLLDQKESLFLNPRQRYSLFTHPPKHFLSFCRIKAVKGHFCLKFSAMLCM